MFIAGETKKKCFLLLSFTSHKQVVLMPGPISRLQCARLHPDAVSELSRKKKNTLYFITFHNFTSSLTRIYFIFRNIQGQYLRFSNRQEKWVRCLQRRTIYRIILNKLENKQKYFQEFFPARGTQIKMPCLYCEFYGLCAIHVSSILTKGLFDDSVFLFSLMNYFGVILRVGSNPARWPGRM